jgi:hypothetical protein
MWLLSSKRPTQGREAEVEEGAMEVGEGAAAPREVGAAGVGVAAVEDGPGGGSRRRAEGPPREVVDLEAAVAEEGRAAAKREQGE